MATDAVLLEGLVCGLSPPSFRLYGWSRPTLSLGYHQKHFESGPPMGTPVVRRPSGGRAVWHSGDLTYALVVPQPPGSLAEGYTYLCRFLVAGCASLGIPLAFGTTGRGYIGNPSCFGTATGADLVYAGRKLIGSAQLRRGGAVLQHGSILMAPDRDTLGVLFGPQTSAGVVGISEIRPGITAEEIGYALEKALEETLGLPLVAAPLSPREEVCIARAQEKYRVGVEVLKPVRQRERSADGSTSL